MEKLIEHSNIKTISKFKYIHFKPRKITEALNTKRAMNLT